MVLGVGSSNSSLDLLRSQLEARPPDGGRTLLLLTVHFGQDTADPPLMSLVDLFIWVAVRARSRMPAVVPMYMSRVMRELACRSQGGREPLAQPGLGMGVLA